MKRLGFICLGAMGAPMARNHAASGADGLGVMITDGAQVQTALLGDDGAAAALPRRRPGPDDHCRPAIVATLMSGALKG